QPNGKWPAVGDLDSARALPVHHSDYWKLGSLCSLAAVLFDDSELAFDSEPGDEVFWLSGANGWNQWDALSEANRIAKSGRNLARKHVLPDSGYAIASTDEDWLLFDAGPIAGGLFEDSTPSTAHGHADPLQVLYWMDGADVLHDSGIPYYTGDTSRVDYFRSPAAHNTLEVSGVSVAQAAGPLAWSHVAPRATLNVRLSEHVWVTHGHLVLPDDVSIDRFVLGIPGSGLWITDRIQSKSARDVSWYWQMGERALKQLQHDPLHFQDDQGLTLRMWTDARVKECCVRKSAATSPAGWRATAYGDQDRGRRLHLLALCEESIHLTTFIGRTSAQAQLDQVVVDNTTLECHAGATFDYESPPGVRVAWSVTDGSRRIVYVAGISEAKGLSSAWREIKGVGELSVASMQESGRQIAHTA
ncbi:MAG: heparinase II/III-family protein, partial [Pseudomonadota bacterium]